MIKEHTSDIAGRATLRAVVAMAVTVQGMVDAVCGRLDASSGTYLTDILPSIQTRWAPNRDIT